MACHTIAALDKVTEAKRWWEPLIAAVVHALVYCTILFGPFQIWALCHRECAGLTGIFDRLVP